ncbi:MAG: GTP-binding protein [Candidatus Njordarchaeia archaeon]
MVFIDHKGNIRIKVVIYGPARSGKTTLIKSLVEEATQTWHVTIKSIEDLEGQTLFFDFAPFQYKGRPIALDIFTVPGKDIHKYQRETIIKGADVIVFVADYTEDRLERNIDSMYELKGLIEGGIPIILVLNKCDLVFRFNKEQLLDKIPEGLNIVRTVECSALMKYNIKKLFEVIINEALKRGIKRD